MKVRKLRRLGGIILIVLISMSFGDIARAQTLIESMDITVAHDSWHFSMVTTESTRYTVYSFDINENLVHTRESPYWSTGHSGTQGGYIPDGEDGYIQFMVVSQSGDIEWWPSESEKYRINRPPLMPHTFYGDVLIDGSPALDVITVVIVIEPVVSDHFEHETYTSGGTYGVDEPFQIPSDDPDTPEREGGVNGDIMYFWVNDMEDSYAGSYVFESGATTNLDLEITTSSYEIQLYQGWNLIGIPFIPDNPDIEVMLLHILDYVEVVWSYDAETWTWSSYSPWVPPMLNDLTEMTDGKGYWIYMNTDVIWELG